MHIPGLKASAQCGIWYGHHLLSFLGNLAVPVHACQLILSYLPIKRHIPTGYTLFWMAVEQLYHWPKQPYHIS